MAKPLFVLEKNVEMPEKQEKIEILIQIWYNYHNSANVLLKNNVDANTRRIT